MPYRWDPGEMTWVWEDEPPEPPSGDIWPQPGSTGGTMGNWDPQSSQFQNSLYNALTQAWQQAAGNPYAGFAGIGSGNNAEATEPGGGGDGSRRRFNRWDQAYEDETRPGGPNEGYVFPPQPGTTGTTGGPGAPPPPPPPPGGGGGGGAPDPYAWMAKFGGKDFVKLFLKKPGERLKDYYARMGGDPVKTLIAKYQEIEGMDPDMNMRTLAIGALGLTGIIDPTTLEEVFSMPQSEYLGSLMKAGPSLANFSRGKMGGGLRTLKGKDWWSMRESMKTWAPTGAAAPPTTVPV